MKILCSLFVVLLFHTVDNVFSQYLDNTGTALPVDQPGLGPDNSFGTLAFLGSFSPDRSALATDSTVEKHPGQRSDGQNDVEAPNMDFPLWQSTYLTANNEGIGMQNSELRPQNTEGINGGVTSDLTEEALIQDGRPGVFEAPGEGVSGTNTQHDTSSKVDVQTPSDTESSFTLSARPADCHSDIEASNSVAARSDLSSSGSIHQKRQEVAENSKLVNPPTGDICIPPVDDEEPTTKKETRWVYTCPPLPDNPKKSMELVCCKYFTPDKKNAQGCVSCKIPLVLCIYAEACYYSIFGFRRLGSKVRAETNARADIPRRWGPNDPCYQSPQVICCKTMKVLVHLN